MTLDEDIRRYVSGTEAIVSAARRVTPANADRRVKGGWSARQVIHHLADSETQSYVRLRRLIAEPPGSTIQGYDEAAWADNEVLGYRELPWENSLAVVVSVRTSSADVLERLTPDDLRRTGVHTQSGNYSLSAWLAIYIEHPLSHASQLIEAIEHGD